MKPITHVFFDIGGVLASNGWDRDQRQLALEKFGLDDTEFQSRHEEIVGSLEQGQIGLDEYLDIAVFHQPRSFSKAEFRSFLLALSTPHPDAIAVAKALARSSQYWMMTMNNEGEDLNVHRIRSFGLDAIFDAFLSSCWLGLRKPARGFYDRALGISQANPRESVFIDDRMQNLEPARALGMHIVHYRSPQLLTAELRELGLDFNLQDQT